MFSLPFCFVQAWGMEVKLKNVVLPCLRIDGFVMTTPQKSSPVKQWKKVEFKVEEFDFVQYVKKRYPDLLDD